MSEVWSNMSTGLHVKYPSFFSDFNETWIFRQIFEKHLNMKFHEIRQLICTDITKLIVAFQNSENAPKTEIMQHVSKKLKVYLKPK